MLAKGLGRVRQVGVLGDFLLVGGTASFRLHPCPATSPDHTPRKGWSDVDPATRQSSHEKRCTAHAQSRKRGVTESNNCASAFPRTQLATSIARFRSFLRRSVANAHAQFSGESLTPIKITDRINYGVQKPISRLISKKTWSSANTRRRTAQFPIGANIQFQITPTRISNL